MQEQIPHIEAKENPWLATLRLWGWVAGIVAVVGGLIYLGVRPLTRKLFTALGWFLPTEVLEEVKLTRRAVVEKAVPLTTDQARALEIRKTTDPAFRAAWDKQAKAEEIA